MQAVAPLVDTLEDSLNLVGVYEIMPNTDLMVLGGSLICRDRSPIQELCANVLFLFGGFNSEQLNRSVLPDIAANTPAGASVGQVAHFGQEVNSGKFRLPNKIAHHLVADEKFNHLDLIYAWGAKEVLYDLVMNLMSEYQV